MTILFVLGMDLGRLHLGHGDGKLGEMGGRLTNKPRRGEGRGDWLLLEDVDMYL